MKIKRILELDNGYIISLTPETVDEKPDAYLGIDNPKGDR
jgi:hypothetical protein